MPLTQQQRERADALYAKYGKLPPRNEIEGLAREMGVKESMVKDHLKYVHQRRPGGPRHTPPRGQFIHLTPISYASRHVQSQPGEATHQNIQDSSAQVPGSTPSSVQHFPQSPSDQDLLGDPDVDEMFLLYTNHATYDSA
ncbi:hypothetical protein FRC08_006806 [Ceratobasidium sp. 394]|nr:hypothetical protein FRC08_006806 [Ceratobasidium sp. 394]KAG9078274.1 hypothetical protein FS749_009744 [Ceratobasidium sp. UAMH 11750]